MVAQPPGPSWGAPPPPPPPPPPPTGVPYLPVVAPPTRFRSLRGLAISMYVLLSIAGLVSLAAIPVAFHARSVVHDNARVGSVLIDRTVQDAVNALSGVIGFLLLVSIAIMVLFIIWMWRAASNLPLFGRVRPKFSPGFAIGGWFIPFANLIIPGMQMFDIDKGSGPRLRAGERAQGSGLVVVWWIAFVVGRTGGFLAPTFELGKRYDIGGFDRLNALLIGASAILAISAVLAIVVIRRITARQELAGAEVSGAGYSGAGYSGANPWGGTPAAPEYYGGAPAWPQPPTPQPPTPHPPTASPPTAYPPPPEPPPGPPPPES